jgi:hypothetical protein
LRFQGGLAPDRYGKLPRNDCGELKVLSEMQTLCATSPVFPSAVQMPYFASADYNDVGELVVGLQDLGMEVHFIAMIDGADPMEPDDEDAVVDQLLTSLEACVQLGIRQVSSTSVESWMSFTSPRREGDQFIEAVAQNVAVHTRAYREAGLAGSCVENWHIEFLRPGEFHTFTDIERAWAVVQGLNAELQVQHQEQLGGGSSSNLGASSSGASTSDQSIFPTAHSSTGTSAASSASAERSNNTPSDPFFKVLVDAAHCGDSGLSMQRNIELIAEIGARRPFNRSLL